MKIKTLESNGYTYVVDAWNPSEAVEALPKVCGKDEAGNPTQNTHEWGREGCDEACPREKPCQGPSPDCECHETKRFDNEFGSNIASYIHASSGMRHRYFEQTIFEKAKDKLKDQIKRCRRKIGVYDIKCSTKSQEDCEREVGCQWFTIEDIVRSSIMRLTLNHSHLVFSNDKAPLRARTQVLIHDVKLPTEFAFETESHFHYTRKAAHDSIWKPEHRGMKNYVQKNYIAKIRMQQDSRRARRTQIRDLCNATHKEKFKTCAELDNEEACNKAFQTLDDCDTRSDCRLCTVDKRCQWIVSATGVGSCSGCEKPNTIHASESARPGCANKCPESSPCQSATENGCLCYHFDGSIPDTITGGRTRRKSYDSVDKCFAYVVIERLFTHSQDKHSNTSISI